MFLPTLLLVVCTASLHLADKPKYFDLEDGNYIQNLYKEYVKEYEKVYSPEEYERRLEIFIESLKDINERNAKYPQVEYGVDHFSDLTAKEKQRYAGMLPFNETFEGLTTLEYSPEEITAPEQWDWREHGAVTPVKCQGECGSCWIFSAIGNIEGQYAIKYKKLFAFSEQQSLDCVTPLAWDNNCDGGYPHRSMWHYRGWQGWDDKESWFVELEADYPYHAEMGPCKEHQLDNKKVAIVESVKIYKPDEETLKQLLYEIGPLSTALDMADLFGYKRGIIHPNKCHHWVDHAVLLVGYGIENGTKYWTVKNSFGPIWGDRGYFRLLRGVNACDFGIRYTATATVKEFNPKSDAGN